MEENPDLTLPVVVIRGLFKGKIGLITDITFIRDEDGIPDQTILTIETKLDDGEYEEFEEDLENIRFILLTEKDDKEELF